MDTRSPLPSAIECPNQPRRRPAYEDEDPLAQKANWSTAERDEYRAAVKRFGQDEADRVYYTKRSRSQERAKARNHFLRMSCLCEEAARETAEQYGRCPECGGKGIVSSLQVSSGGTVGRGLFTLGEDTLVLDGLLDGFREVAALWAPRQVPDHVREHLAELHEIVVVTATGRVIHVGSPEW